MRNVDLSLVENLKMPIGIGNLEQNEACVVAQAAIVDKLQQGLEITEVTDELKCSCPVLRILAIALNDINWWASVKERTAALRPLISMLLDSRVSYKAIAKRAKLASDFARFAAEYAAKYAVVAKYAVNDAEYAAKYAEYAEYAAGDAAKYAVDSVNDAEYAAKYAAKYAVNAAAEYAEYAAKYAAGDAASVFVKPLRDELLKTWMECEAIK